METQKHVSETIEASEPVLDQVAAAQAALVQAKEAETAAQAALVEAKETVKHAEAAFEAEEERLAAHKRNVSRAVLAKESLPSAPASMLDAIEDAVFDAKERVKEAERELASVRNRVEAAATGVRNALDSHAREKIADIFRAQRAQLFELASNLHWGWSRVEGGLAIKRDTATLEIAFDLPSA